MLCLYILEQKKKYFIEIIYFNYGTIQVYSFKCNLKMRRTIKFMLKTNFEKNNPIQ